MPTAGDAALKVARTNYLAGAAGTSNLLARSSTCGTIANGGDDRARIQ
ncbi:hypothetical protein Rwratislav_06815 [Rhodococcus wratislaviensis IFP 2016]|uniref:Uncharacterized protein n=1 Tax=Rhodococcus opacus M213 TaxID=1129896 RepID=K8XKV2_RHOOP|nr:hypothetical protein WSS_A36243 [Rhodococcus opacus M213]ELB93872.1 hypothetical protein Rwratislav_06815 [Rhodococcus wratislaviensis IFP 2016]